MFHHPIRPEPRIRLRPPRAEDCEELLALVRASRAFHRPWAYPPADGKAFEAYLRAASSARGETRLAVLEDGGAIVGSFSLSEIVRGRFQSSYLGFWAGAPYAGRGLMSEGLQLLLRRAFGPLGLHRVEANVQPGNHSSLRLVERAGFRREGYSPRYLKIGGRWRDHERWAILAEEWRARPDRNRSA